ncbi:MAG: hypothetical protein A3E53_03745 [Gammaproteobacteria bacterium RIFCSPHIGHO2_12_FULL_39_24]|nr:MAG: hypothetical protein A3E53_03745 [Gammaproteobacteria bacterium RIFCSPHIGHO2_12_FULL_39_24]
MAENYFVVEKNSRSVHHSSSQPNPNEIDGLPKPILKAAINAYLYAIKQNDVRNLSMLTIVDFNKPSYEKRLWVIDLHNKHIIMNIHVAQGRNSGKIYPTHFSNDPNSHESSLGIFTTYGQEYHGAFGKSLHVRGLESDINSNALSRGIVIHSEWDITPKFIRTMGYAGRTWGCFAVNPDHINRIIELLQDDSVLFVYASPEKEDPLVAHPLSSEGEKLYQEIIQTNSNPLVRFFETF